MYQQPLKGESYAIQTPFPRAEKYNNIIKVREIREQDKQAIYTIKNNRAHDNLDVLVTNNEKLRYECVWGLADDNLRWLCIFALDIYGWKNMGSHSDQIPSRGCVGIYTLPDFVVPPQAARNKKSNIIIPNINILDPFAN